MLKNILKTALVIIPLTAMLSTCGKGPNASFSPSTLALISVAPLTSTIAKGTTQQFTATGTFADGTTRDITSAVSWSSSSTSVATIDNIQEACGLATSVTPGSTIITASSEGISGSTTLTVTPAALVSITVTPGNPSIGFGTSQQFTATGTFTDTTTQNLTSSVLWSSSTTSVATISNIPGSNGLVSTLSAGATTIKAIDSATSISGSSTLTITTVQMGGAIQGNILNLTTAVTTFAGMTLSPGSSDGTGTAARFFIPHGITSDGTNLYVTDVNNAIRKIVISTAVVTHLAGGSLGSTDGVGSAASFNNPLGITTDGMKLYVADTFNSTIREVVISSGSVTTLAGSAGVQGFSDGTGTAALFSLPYGITTDGTNLYVADSTGTIRKIVIASGSVTTVAGTAGVWGSSNGIGTAALFNQPCGITTDGTNLYIADFGNCTIRKIVIASGLVTTIAGTTGVCGSTDGVGTAALFCGPEGITTDGTNLYVTNSWNNDVRKIVISSGLVTTIAGSTTGLSGGTDGIGTSATFYYPFGITTDGTDLYLADSDNYTIRRIE